MFSNGPSMRTFVPRLVVDGEELPEMWPEETMIFNTRNVKVAKSVDSAAPGRLFITSKRVIFLSEDGKLNVDFDVPFITLHAVSRDPQTYPQACVYCQLDCEEDFDAQPICDGEDDIEEEEEDNAMEEDVEEVVDDAGVDDNLWKELFIVPNDEQDVMSLFEALSQAALLNPDDEDEDDVCGDFIFDLNEVQLGADQARALDHLESVFHLPGESGADN